MTVLESVLTLKPALTERSYSRKENAKKAALCLSVKHVPIERVAIIDGQPFARWYLVPAETQRKESE
jgi:hypothetical protein